MTMESKTIPPCGAEPPILTTRPGVKRKLSYGQILKSTVTIGGASAATIAIGILRTKAMALLLGPTGFGLMGLYSSIFDVTRSIAGMGINSSGVRQIAEAVGTEDLHRIARTVIVLRWSSLVLGVSGAFVLLLCCRPISWLTFGNTGNAAAVAFLSLAVFFRLISDGQGALLQGLRRIEEIAKISVYGSIFGTFAAIPLIYFFREQGVALALVAISGLTLLTSWHFSRTQKAEALHLTTTQVYSEVGALLKLGAAFMASGFLTLGSAYAIRMMIVRFTGLESAGLYQASWTLGGLYIGFVLQAMGADFYPRLTGVAEDNEECNRLVNEQTLVSVLLAGPGIIATLTFAPLVISLFYTGQFHATVPILRWICIGMMMRVVIWPIGFVVLAKGAQGCFFWSEVAWAVAHILLAWPLLGIFGVNGAGMAFLGAYLVHGALILAIVRSLSGFRWSRLNQKAILLLFSLVALAFTGFLCLSPVPATGVGIAALILSGFYSLRTLIPLAPVERLPRIVHKIARRIGIIAPDAVH